jgi:hypothetical protein
VTELEDAEARLNLPEYQWLLGSTKPFWLVKEVADVLLISTNTVKKWCADGLVPGAVDFGSGGWRIPRTGLIIFLASRLGKTHDSSNT